MSPAQQHAERAQRDPLMNPIHTESDAEETTRRKLAPGLYLVGTPIGNLEDITLRALRVLRSVDLIACEDTRQTQKLLNHFAIATPTLSCHQHNERERALELAAAIQAGRRVALVSDAGMPGISDPGAVLVQAALAAGIQVFPIPGANAAISALVACGLSTAQFQFFGFLPEKSGARRTYLESIAHTRQQQTTREMPSPTLIFYEAPHRILDTLRDMQTLWSDALPVVVARELTKIHEEFLRGTVAEVMAQLARMERVRGEITLLISPVRADPGQDTKRATVIAQVESLQSMDGVSEKDALKQLARETGRSKSELYRELQRERAQKGKSRQQ